MKNLFHDTGVLVRNDANIITATGMALIAIDMRLEGCRKRRKAAILKAAQIIGGEEYVLPIQR
jgi:hypothetical protein